MKYQLQHLPLAAFALWLCGCASSSIKQSWTSPTHRNGPVQKISVLAVDEHSTVRQGLENRFVLELRSHGQQDALATHELLGLAEIKADKESAAARLRAAGADVVLIVRLVDSSTRSTEVRANPELYIPTLSGYEGYGWHDYYSVAFVNMGVGWGATKQDIYLDSSLFDLKTAQRLWSALTLTVLKEDADRLAEADSLVAKIVKALRKDGMVR